MDLLTDAQRADIRVALHDVADTFFKTPVVYTLKGGVSLDPFQEGRKDQREDIYNLMALVTFPHSGGEWGKELPAGLLNQAHIKVTLNWQDLQALGLTDQVEKTVPFREGRDWFSTQGRDYKVLFVHYAGPLDRQAVLINLYGQNRT